MSATRRALHWVFKVGDRTKTAKFYREVLGMKFLRHEEFEEGCKASCNGPYDGKWSKSMVGFGPEDDHFVVELTYNYGLGSYQLGNDMQGITVHSKQAVENAASHNWPSTQIDGATVVKAPDGYPFILVDKQESGDPVKKVTLSSSNLQRTIDYWTKLCGMKIFSQSDKSVTLGYSDNQCKLEFVDIGQPIDHAKAGGRIAFSCPRAELPDIESQMKAAGQTILTPLVSLDTPGKATVEVVILADPDGYEICFVGDEAFRELSQMDSTAEKLIDEAIAADKSDEWFAKKGLVKSSE
ncbi:glyoxalase domain-containing protein 4 [Lingula anatina]|uniref:Glyoxalase domain-containing protein 4 n=1 Tax=Lingula anatina TaxID=7574 RepID=A0A1S3HPV3_LINAN|nr:glyoxalase domain-containing protein 4 [Lingula anatina]|eukprot:XP_013387571.1 glyoxalase domain-containing protein 4 [Lingula anatina]